MQLDGLYIPYKLNRLLTQQEKGDQFYQGKPTRIEGNDGRYIVDYNTVISMNSTYMETVDKYYRDKGYVSSLS
ncbi:hypothetical protein, partial [Photorhabdus heterorhabditis]|uniref:hypothetical protein n=1 Tax=Photorhabdus heterorhabditis TaxID=880156 RepID=UPI001EC8B806|nr:hypothetical protein [Photorhabdus heterorhabditis]